MATTARVKVGSTTYDEVRTGELTVVKLIGFGTAIHEVAARIVTGGKPIAVILEPLERWNKSYGGWHRDDEYRFQDAVKKVAAHLGGEAELRQNPL